MLKEKLENSNNLNDMKKQKNEKRSFEPYVKNGRFFRADHTEVDNVCILLKDGKLIIWGERDKVHSKYKVMKNAYLESNLKILKNQNYQKNQKSLNKDYKKVFSYINCKKRHINNDKACEIIKKLMKDKDNSFGKDIAQHLNESDFLQWLESI